jgi:hypothetical protein
MWLCFLSAPLAAKGRNRRASFTGALAAGIAAADLSGHHPPVGSTT